MGRNKAKQGALTKAEKKLQKEGILQRSWDPSGKNLSHSAPDFDPGQHSRMRRDSHIHSRGSKDSWLHGALFVVLAAISGRSRRLASELDRAVRGPRRGDADRAEDRFEQHVLGRTNPLDGVMIGRVVSWLEGLARVAQFL